MRTPRPTEADNVELLITKAHRRKTAKLLITFGFFIFYASSTVSSAASPEGVRKHHRGKTGHLASLSPKHIYTPPLKSNVPAMHEVSQPSSATLEHVSLQYNNNGEVFVPAIPAFSSVYKGKVIGISDRNDIVQYTIDAELQNFVRTLVSRVDSPHVAVVAMEPASGKILAVAEKSKEIQNLSLHTGFPAASLFKLVTAAAAIEKGLVSPESIINFRGGTYTIDRFNFFPNLKLDRRSMSLAEALGRSCNPVFARVALRFLTPNVLRYYADMFGFNSSLGFQTKLEQSSAMIPDDTYEMGRTAAGFGEVRLSPIHAAVIMAGIANGGRMPKPSFVERVINPQGAVVYQTQPSILKQTVKASTAETLLEMMTYTTTIGTSRKEFMSKNKPVFSVPVAAKTGTLKGLNPKGLNNWFIATAPLTNPKIAVSVIVVNPGNPAAKASHIGRVVLEKYFGKQL